MICQKKKCHRYEGGSSVVVGSSVIFPRCIVCGCCARVHCTQVRGRCHRLGDSRLVLPKSDALLEPVLLQLSEPKLAGEVGLRTRGRMRIILLPPLVLFGSDINPVVRAWR